MLTNDLIAAMDAVLEPWRFQDFGPNGLQVQGKPEIKRIVSGVTASRALIEAAIDAEADAIFVHHGLFWRGQSGCLTGWLRERVALLLAHDINLIAYHLPLDAQPEFGNNAQLGKRLGFSIEQNFGDQALGCLGTAQFSSAQELSIHIETVLQRPVTLVTARDKPIRKVAWCTGGAQSYFEAAIAAGADAFITGEISEPQAHLARECHVAFLACGHHATERYGAPAFAAHMAQQYGLQHQFIEIDNPA